MKMIKSWCDRSKFSKQFIKMFLICLLQKNDRKVCKRVKTSARDHYMLFVKWLITLKYFNNYLKERKKILPPCATAWSACA